jgi:triacylglycerol lipase
MTWSGCGLSRGTDAGIRVGFDCTQLASTITHNAYNFPWSSRRHPHVTCDEDAPIMLIVLQHGIFGFGTIALPLKVVEYFWGIGGRLERRGHRVIAPSVSPLGGIKSRAERLNRIILAEAREGEKIVLIGHSMGGLDGRYLVSKLAAGAKVAALVTIATPHRGSPMADAVVQFDMPRLDPFKLVGIDSDGVRNLTTDHMAGFNAEMPNREGVRYYAVPVACKAEKVPWFFKFSHGLIAKEEGENDGMVSIKSAAPPEEVGRWEVEETWWVDHLNAANMKWPGADGVDVGEKYEQIVSRLEKEL